VSSVAGEFPRGTYSAHKAWTTTFTQGLAGQLAGRGVRVTVLVPGFVRTEFQQRMGAARAQRLPSWLWLDADEVVATALRDLDAGRVVSVPSLRYRLIRRGLHLAPDRALRRSGKVVL
jgi:short-subunit dehydrogenase